MERSVSEAMRISDYNEMMLRVEIMRGKNKQNTTYTNHTDTTLTITDDEYNPMGKATVTTNGNFTAVLEVHQNMDTLTTYLQQGLHTGVDILTDGNFQHYDSLLTAELRRREIDVPHQLKLLHKITLYSIDSTFTEVIGKSSDSTYLPSKYAKRYDYSFDKFKSYTYSLWMEPFTFLILRQMTGIFITSFIILLIQGLSFWYLVRLLLKQKALEEMKSDFTNNITHELKTPIAVAYAANDALLNFNMATEKEKRDKYLQICQNQLQRLSELVEQILSMSMEGRKTFRLHPEELELTSLLNSLIEQHLLKAQKPVKIECEIVPEDLSVMADRTHFCNIISNLIDNAIKYSFEDSVIRIRCNKVSDRVQVAVSDNGIGISKEKQKHIFDKFYRVPTGNLHNVKGYGLGLYYVKTMIEKLGGVISVESEPGRGSTFTILL